MKNALLVLLLFLPLSLLGHEALIHETRTGFEFSEEQYFKAKSLHTENLVADVSIKNHDDNEISVKMTGSHDSLSHTRVELRQDGRLIIAQSAFVGQRRPINLEIYLPHNIPLRLNGHSYGRWNIERIHAPCYFNLEGAVALNITEIIGDVEFVTVGRCNIDVGKITGACILDVEGGARFNLASGTLYNWVARIRGTGNIICKAEAVDPYISINGSGKVFIEKIRGDSDVHIRGRGNVRIKSGVATTFDAHIAGDGHIKFSGETTDSADLSIKGSGTIEIGAVHGTVKKRSGFGWGTGVIKIAGKE